MVESIDLMQQHKSNTLIQEEKQRLNRLKREEVILGYRFVSPLYYRNGQENEKFKQIVQNFEPPIHYVVE